MARYALVIGISEYQSPLPCLPKTTTDAEAVAQLLEKHGAFQEVKRLPARWNSEKKCYETSTKGATGVEIGEALRTFLLEQATKSDALIYFTGHGFTVCDSLGQSKGFLATSDCVLETQDKRIVEQRRAIPLDSFNKLIGASSLSSLVVLLDCCHSGNFLERNLVEQTLTAFSQKDYYFITACRGFEKAYVGEENSVFTRAVLKGLSLDNADPDGKVSGDRLFDCIGRELKRSGQEALRMGWGGSIAVVSYGEGDRSPISAPQPVSPANNTSVITGATITNLSGSGQINYTEAANTVRNLTINLPSFQPTPSSASSTQSRCQRLRKELNNTVELLEDYKQEERLASNPKERQRAKIEQERLQQKIEEYEQEINKLGC